MIFNKRKFVTSHLCLVIWTLGIRGKTDNVNIGNCATSLSGACNFACKVGVERYFGVKKLDFYYYEDEGYLRAALG